MPAASNTAATLWPAAIGSSRPSNTTWSVMA
jgi:hypothetical protein